MNDLDDIERGFLLILSIPCLLIAGLGSAAKFSIGEWGTACWLAGYALVALAIAVIAIRRPKETRRD